MLNEKGFTLAEILVVTAIFVIVMMITTSAFDNIIKTGRQQERTAATQTEGIVGLEMLRSDLEHIGYGLPWSLQNPPASFSEVTENKVDGVVSASFNDSVPRAVQLALTPNGKMILDKTSVPAGPNPANTNPGAAYLVVKSTRVALDKAASRWSYVNYSASATGTNLSKIKKWNTPDDFVPNDRVITIRSSFSNTGSPDKQLMMKSSAEYSYLFPSGTDPMPPDDAYKPGDKSQLFTIYGVQDAGTATPLRMPYNRADYYVRLPDAGLPQSCNPGTGTLYKAVVRQYDGKYMEYPLLNCVGDMQVEFELDPDNSGNTTYAATLGTMAAGDIRTQLKTVWVYILAHEGKKDPAYTYPKNSIQVGDISRSSSGRLWDGSDSCTGNSCLNKVFGNDWRNYRWKVYTISARPKNLN